MNASALSVYALSVVVLFVKFFGTISIQAVERLRHRHFLYPEDAKTWSGVVGEDTDRCIRAQRLLRNDGESQLWYLALGYTYVLLGAWPAGAPVYFGCYTLSRLAHAYFLIMGRQPHRNRAFSIGMTILFVLAGHVTYAVLEMCLPI
jgi:MAPEG family